MSAKSALVFIFVLALFMPLAYPQGSFTCPYGQTEDLQCAATCCQQAGGTYSFSEETCTVGAQSQLDQAFACEQQTGCCKSSGSTGSTPSSGCCGGAFVLALTGLLVFTRS
jgi:hypothetical protein